MSAANDNPRCACAFVQFAGPVGVMEGGCVHERSITAAAAAASPGKLRLITRYDAAVPMRGTIVDRLA